MHPTAKAKLFFIETNKIMLGGKLHRVVIRKICLQHYLTRCVAASGASRDLCQQLEGPLGGAEIGHTQSHVGSHHAD